MVVSGVIDTRRAGLRDREGGLGAGCLLDWLSDGPSAVYSFFDPHETRRSLGTFVVLSLIEAAKQAQAPHVYLGYWIERSRKMAYKTRFQPLEGLGADRSEEHTSELQSLMRISYAVFCLKKKHTQF